MDISIDFLCVGCTNTTGIMLLQYIQKVILNYGVHGVDLDRLLDARRIKNDDL